MTCAAVIACFVTYVKAALYRAVQVSPANQVSGTEYVMVRVALLLSVAVTMRPGMPAICSVPVQDRWLPPRLL
jgi:hypothetical protein